jgi:hypothetical protein
VSQNPHAEQGTSPPKPIPIKYTFEKIPAYLRERRQWVCWRYEITEKQKWTKVPYQAASLGAKASSTRSAEWATFEDTVAAYRNPDAQYDGIGYCVDHAGGEVLTMVDIDHVVICTDGKPTGLWPMAQDAVAMLQTYTELSVSGTGIHLLAFGPKPKGRCRKAGFEMYGHDRFFTFTGQKLKSAPATIEERAEQILAVHAKYLAEAEPSTTTPASPGAKPSRSQAMTDDEVLAHCRRAKNADKFVALYERGERGGDDSADDFALIGLLHFYTQDAAQIERLMRGSALTRPKWDSKRAGRTWLTYSIENALKKDGEVYEGPTPKPTIGGSASSSTKTKLPPVKWRSGGDLDPTPITYLVEGVVPDGMLGAIAGRDGRGKTLLGMEIAKCVLTGEKLFGEFAVRPGKAFLMLLDDPENLVRDRLERMGILNHPNLKVATRKDVDLKDKPGMLSYLKQTLPPLDPTFVMIDALYHFYPGGGSGQDQANNASAMGPVMEVFDELASAIKGTLALVAHDNKAGSDIAGSQVIRNELKWILRLVLPPEFEKKPEEGVMTDERVLQLNKLKVGRNTSWHLKIGAPGEWVFRGDSAAYRKATLEDRIVIRVFDHGAHTVEELQGALKARPADVREACLRLHTAGKLTRGERPRKDGKGRPSIVYDHPVPKA